jgi:hypothetical protein
MGTISVQYNKKPSVVDAFKMDMSLPIIDFNVEHVEGKEYAIYSACKYKDQIIAVIGLIRYDYLNKEVFIKIMDESIKLQFIYKPQPSWHSCYKSDHISTTKDNS